MARSAPLLIWTSRTITGCSAGKETFHRVEGKKKKPRSKTLCQVHPLVKETKSRRRLLRRQSGAELFPLLIKDLCLCPRFSFQSKFPVKVWPRSTHLLPKDEEFFSFFSSCGHSNQCNSKSWSRCQVEFNASRATPKQPQAPRIHEGEKGPFRRAGNAARE